VSECEPKIGLFDMDGTLFGYTKQLEEDMRRLMAPGEEEPADLWDESKPYLKARMDLIKRQPGWWRALPKHQLGWDVLGVAQELQFKLKVLSKGPAKNPQAWAEKVQCLWDHFGGAIKPDIVGEDKEGQYGHFLVEDYWPYIRGWLKWRPRGLVILIDAPYNRAETHPNVLRYDGSNLGDVRRFLAAVAARKDGEHWRAYL
jgi:5'-nucleotidase